MFWDHYFPDEFYYPEVGELEFMNLYFDDVYIDIQDILDECYFPPERTWNPVSINDRFTQRAIISSLLERMESDNNVYKDPILLIINFIEEIEDYENEMEENNLNSNAIRDIHVRKETLEDVLCILQGDLEYLY